MLLGSKKVQMCRYKKRVCIPRVLSCSAQWYLVPTQVTATVSCSVMVVCKQGKIVQSQGAKHVTAWTIWHRQGGWVNESVEELSDWVRKGEGWISNICHQGCHTNFCEVDSNSANSRDCVCFMLKFNINQTNCASSPQPRTSHRVSFRKANVIPHTYTWGCLVSHVSDELLPTIMLIPLLIKFPKMPSTTPLTLPYRKPQRRYEILHHVVRTTTAPQRRHPCPTRRGYRYVVGYTCLTQLTHFHSHSCPANDTTGTSITNPTRHSPSKNAMTSTVLPSPSWVANN